MVILLDLLDPSVMVPTRRMFPVASWWSTKRHSDMTVNSFMSWRMSSCSLAMWPNTFFQSH